MPAIAREARLLNGFDVLAARVRRDDTDLVSELRARLSEGVDVEGGSIGPSGQLAELVSQLSGPRSSVTGLVVGRSKDVPISAPRS